VSRAPAVALLALGLMQMLGDLTGLAPLRGLAAATAASPAPRVFSAVGGLETYSLTFRIEWADRGGIAHSLELTPERYARLRGAYNRRNAYGAVVAYGPLLSESPATRPLFESVARHALCGDAPLLRELGIDPDDVMGAVRIRLEPLPGTDPGDLELVLEAPCRY
jgi:hypothetical protein